MSFNEFQNDVNGLMDILWSGGVASHATIIEQLNYLMFIRALTKKDDNSIALDPEAEQLFQGELSKYRWDNLLMLNAEALFSTLEELFRRLPEWTSDKTIRQLFQDAHVKVFDKPTLRRVVHEIDKMMVEMDKEYVGGHTDVFGDMYEHLLSKMAQAGTLGQFRTPRHIIDFIVDVVDPEKGETILDPACGTAGFLIAALKHLKEKYTSEEYKKENRLTLDLLKPEERQFLFNNTFTGFDSDFDMFKFGLMNLYLHHLEHPNLKRQNTLVDTAGDRTKWDVILANPPFAGAVDRDSISEDLRMGTRATEVLFLKYIIDHLSPNGKAGVIVPEGIIFSGSNAHKKIRKMLVEDSGLWSVVSLPPGIFNPYAGVKTSILFLDKRKKDTNNEILLLKIESDGFDLGAQRKPNGKNDLPYAIEILTDWKIGKKKEDKMANWVEKKAITSNGDYDLRGEKYMSVSTKQSYKWETVDIDEVCLVRKGTAITRKDVTPGLVPVVAGGKRPAYYHNMPNREANTITVSASGAYAGYVNYWTVPIFASDCSTITVKDPTIASSKFIFYMLKGLQEEIYKLQQGGGQPHVYPKDLVKLQIPLPPIEVQAKIVAELDRYNNIINGARVVVENWAPSFNIPKNSQLVKLGELFNLETGVSVNSERRGRREGEFGILKTSAVTYGWFNPDENKVILPSEISRAKTTPHQDNIIISRMNTPELVGASAYVEQDYPELYLPDRLWQTVRKRKDYNMKYIFYIISSPSFRKLITDSSGGTSGSMKNISKETFLNFEVPLPNIQIQDSTVETIEGEKNMVNLNGKFIKYYENKINQKIKEVWEVKEK